MVLNKTNSSVLAAAYGDDTAAWLGKGVEIWTEPTMFQGKVVAGIKVAPVIPSAAAGNGAAVTSAHLSPSLPNAALGIATARSTTPAGDLDEDIPF